jgi:hypothetical protein
MLLGSGLLLVRNEPADLVARVHVAVYPERPGTRFAPGGLRPA